MPFAEPRVRASSQQASSRTYALSTGWRILLVLSSIVLGSGAVALGLSARSGGGARPAAFLLLAAFLAGVAVYALAALRARLTIAGDLLSIEEPFVHRQLLRGEIAGRRVVPGRYGTWHVELIPAQARHQPLRISSSYGTDGAFDGWLATIPDLDAADAAEALVEVRQELAEALGPEVVPPGPATAASADAPAATLDGALSDRLAGGRLVAGVLTALAVAGAAWALLGPRPWGALVAFLGALPVAAIAAAWAWRGIIVIDRSRADPRPTVLWAVLVPSFVLGVRTVLDVPLASRGAALIAAAIAGAGLAFLASRVDGHLKKDTVTVVMLAVWLTTWGYGAVVAADVLLDRSEPEVHAARVIAKQANLGKFTIYTIRLEAWGWGPNRKDVEIDVTEEAFRHIRERDTVNVLVRPGALWIPWYAIQTR